MTCINLKTRKFSIMKNLLISGILGVLLLSSCNKFLQESPRSAIPVSAYFSSVQEATSAVNWLYNKSDGPGNFLAINGSLYDGTGNFTLDNFSGMVNDVVAQNPAVRYYTTLTQTADNQDSYLDGFWSGFYSSIASANSIIANVGASSNISANDKAPLLAAARFFRALDYYYLVRMWGAVPLILNPYTSVKNVNAPRTSVDSVYNAIVNDLTWAKDSGNLADKPMGSNGNLISKGTVECVLAEVYLTMAGYPLQKGQPAYQNALVTAQALLGSSGGYGLFQSSGNVTAFDKFRLTNYDQGSAYLYFLEFNSAIQQSAFPEYTLPNTFPNPIPNTSLKVQYTLVTNPWVPSTQLLNMYDSANDIRRHDHQYYASNFSYINNSGTLTTINFPTPLPYIWYDSTALFSTAASGKYLSVYRMDDVYLIAAEAANALGQDPAPYLQPILDRAYINPPAIPSDQTGRRNLILAERYRELAMEGHFWFDMVRTKLYPDVGNNHQVTFSDFIGHNNGRGQNFSEKDLLLPLPITEMQRDPNLRPQNPGY
ncbi:MAG: RagB/SusD family nutrient uptake outer membrane protein [Chitinophagaceae bacterium]|nr:MAG: RagB/SusD family nutrient uptake outer membrane protein [Chitinophagaceae bacterium]